MEEAHYPETNSSHLKMNGWNTIVSFWGWPIFRCEPLVSGGVHFWNLLGTEAPREHALETPVQLHNAAVWHSLSQCWEGEWYIFPEVPAHLDEIWIGSTTGDLQRFPNVNIYIYIQTHRTCATKMVVKTTTQAQNEFESPQCFPATFLPSCVGGNSSWIYIQPWSGTAKILGIQGYLPNATTPFRQ